LIVLPRSSAAHGTSRWLSIITIVNHGFFTRAEIIRLASEGYNNLEIQEITHVRVEYPNIRIVCLSNEKPIIKANWNKNLKASIYI